MSPPPWPEERMAEMVRLFHLGWSAGKIASAIGSTRNSVVGKLNREGLKRNPGFVPDNRIPYPKTREKPERRPPEPVQRVAGRVVLEVEDPVPLELLRPRRCKFPINRWNRGEGHLALFCGSETDSVDRVYCPRCEAIAFRAPGDMPKKASSKVFF